jgi:hypothetical protein
MTKEEKLERLMDLGATPEAISKYLNMETSMVEWYIKQIKKESEEK